ncbi:peptide/nickel transport system substrate-binding protein [Desulfacinum infernum DSM 9756]|uniref:Peptide/nickel transport system substrate-binding protein n=1 Tax=Desulfacinum infernum DSM 9756 TaxID=1121391 RepID=A0A1M4YH86_9BACT|nr:ABC transporter substrate-binding protein [Desulfacinum infernum]SHF05018.1 peptide/nickel transport system substrate-binding protein [Desulfacinum infernum DSM 9756]
MRKWCVLLTLLVSLCPGLAGAADQPVTGGTLIWGRGGDSVSLDLAQATDGESIKAGIQIYENLVKFGDNSMDIEPQLATSWEVSEDGLTWTFHLRKGVTFHDGTPFNAQAVYDSFARVIDENHPFHSYGKWAYLSLSLGMVKEVKVVDDYTVQLVTKKPYAPLLNNLALWLCPIVSPKAMAEYKDQIGMHPVGTGPFKFVKWVKDDQIVLERNENYWGDKAKVDRIILKSIPEPSARLMALQSGTVDIADDLDPDSIALVKKDPNLEVIEKPSINIGYLALNTEKPALKDVRVRQAIAHAIDKDTLIKAIFQGLAIPAKNPFAPTIWGYNDEIQPYAYDPQKAKKLLEEAGFDFSTELELWAMPVSRAYMPEPVKTAELIQAYLAAVGMKAKIVRYDWGTYLKKTANGEHDMCMLGWLGGNADPDNFLYGLLSADTAVTPGAANVALWKNAEFTELVKQAQKIFDKEERAKLYKKAQEIFHREVPWVPLAHSTIVRCYNKKLHDVPLRPNGLNSFQMVWKEK